MNLREFWERQMTNIIPTPYSPTLKKAASISRMLLCAVLLVSGWTNLSAAQPPRAKAPAPASVKAGALDTGQDASDPDHNTGLILVGLGTLAGGLTPLITAVFIGIERIIRANKGLPPLPEPQPKP